MKTRSRGSMPVAAAPAEAPDGAWACAAGSALAAAAATQWTGGFNPCPASVPEFAALYEAAR